MANCPQVITSWVYRCELKHLFRDNVLHLFELGSSGLVETGVFCFATPRHVVFFKSSSLAILEAFSRSLIGLLRRRVKRLCFPNLLSARLSATSAVAAPSIPWKRTWPINRFRPSVFCEDTGTETPRASAS